MTDKKNAAAAAQTGGYNTTDLANDLATNFGFTKAQAARIVAATFCFIGNAISRGDLVRLHSFGNFKKLATNERVGRNPQTGEETTIPASHRPHFVASQNLKDKVKSGTQEQPEVQAPAAPDATAPAQPKVAPVAKQAKPKARPQAAPTPRPRPQAQAPKPADADVDSATQSAIDEL